MAPPSGRLERVQTPLFMHASCGLALISDICRPKAALHQLFIITETPNCAFLHKNLRTQVALQPAQRAQILRKFSADPARLRSKLKHKRRKSKARLRQEDKQTLTSAAEEAEDSQQQPSRRLHVGERKAKSRGWGSRTLTAPGGRAPVCRSAGTFVLRLCSTQQDWSGAPPTARRSSWSGTDEQPGPRARRQRPPGEPRTEGSPVPAPWSLLSSPYPLVPGPRSLVPGLWFWVRQKTF